MTLAQTCPSTFRNGHNTGDAFAATACAASIKELPEKVMTIHVSPFAIASPTPGNPVSGIRPLVAAKSS